MLNLYGIEILFPDHLISSEGVAFMNEIEDLLQLLKSKIPIIVIETREEAEALHLIGNLAIAVKRPVYGWSIIKGLSQINAKGEITGESLLEPTEALLTIYNTKYPGLYVLIDFHPYLQNDRNVRLLKEIARYSEQLAQTVILVSPQIEISQDLKHLTARFEIPFPSEENIKGIVRYTIDKCKRENPSKQFSIDDSLIPLFVKNLRGLSVTEIKRIIYNALRDNSLTKEDVPEIGKAKYELLNKDDVLYYEHNTASFAQVGGLKSLKAWLDKRRTIFIGERTVLGNDVPKGILLLGVQGSGKSLAAKSVAGTWGIPLLRLDFGTLYNKYYGETERKTREALKMAEMMAPCVLWIDEIEKGIASDSNDSGTSKRVLGTLLTWMAERKKCVFIVATANDIQNLPPELMRKGRLDEIFFVDLPDSDVRKEIFEIHLRKRELDPGKFDLEQLAKESEGFSGSEIEQVIVSGLYSADGGYLNLTTEILSDEIKRTKPLSVIMAENINDMREWAKDRTVPAN